MNHQRASPLVEMPDVKATEVPTFRFDQLPQRIRIRIYNHLIPECFIFKGGRTSNTHGWPMNPITNLVASSRALHALSSEVDKHLYSKPHFEFHSIGRGKTRVKGCETANEFFVHIGPKKLSYIVQINCEFTWWLRKSSIGTFSQMLSYLAASDPPRDLRNLDLIFEEAQDVVLAGQNSPMQCFTLRGFIGLDLNVTLGTKTRLTTKNMNDWRPKYAQANQGLPRFHYLDRLPNEIKIMIYRHMIPQRSLIGPRVGTRSSSGRGILGVLLSNSQLSVEIRTLLYRECEFEFRATTLWDHVPQVTSFLQEVGTNALDIRHVKIVLCIYGVNSCHYNASILPIVTALNRYCSFQFTMPIQLVDFQMNFNRKINRFCARWKVVTRAKTELMVQVQTRSAKKWFLNHVTDIDLADKLHTVVAASLEGFQTRIGIGGEVWLRRN